jgi:hypothetical protein
MQAPFGTDKLLVLSRSLVLDCAHLSSLCMVRGHPMVTTSSGPRNALRADPEGPTLILLRSFTTRISFHLLLLPCFCSTHRVDVFPTYFVLTFKRFLVLNTMWTWLLTYELRIVSYLRDSFT